MQDFISYDPARTTDTISETQFLAAHQTRLAQGISKCGTAHRREIKIAAKWTFSLDMRNTAPKTGQLRDKCCLVMGEFFISKECYFFLMYFKAVFETSYTGGAVVSF